MSFTIEHQRSLKTMNTFGVDAKASQFCRFHDSESLKIGLQKAQGLPKLILGGGSNILFTSDFHGMVLKNEVLGITILEENDATVRLEVGAGVPWHELVLYSVNNEWGGIENMSLIPGSCGAAPMQNIGAYGAEIKDTFISLKAFHIQDGEFHSFSKTECEFGYRESVFKRKLKGQYVIYSIVIELKKQPELNTSYGAILQELERMNKTPSVKSISDAVIHIRQSKLPDPAIIGNAGSFFKNPVIPMEHFEELQKLHSDIPNYQAPDGRKLAAGWLIEQCGWKGKDLGGYGVHDRQALVLVNRGAGTGEKLFSLSTEIIDSVRDRFQVELEREVNVI